jgi:hypothetical protein
VSDDRIPIAGWPFRHMSVSKSTFPTTGSVGARSFCLSCLRACGHGTRCRQTGGITKNSHKVLILPPANCLSGRRPRRHPIP